MSETKACRSCGAPIIWAYGTSGKANPMNAQPDPDGNVMIVNGNQAVYEGEQMWYFAADSHPLRYTSHFATCPAASTWRKKS